MFITIILVNRQPWIVDEIL